MNQADTPSSNDASSSCQRQLITRLCRQINETLGPLLQCSGRVALLDFPNYPNVGDSAIWLGVIEYLRARGIDRVCYSSDWFTYSRAHLAARVGSGTILMSGGGNLGDLWPHHQHFREEVIASFPHNRIIQLPQSIWFEDREALERARRVFDRHPDLTLLVREHQSLAIARREFGARSELCPDMAFCLGPLRREIPPSRPFVFLARTDHESRGLHHGGNALERVDWRIERTSWLSLLHRVSRHLPIGSPALRWLRGPLSRTYEPLARRRVERGCRLLGAGRVVVSDRLHGHVLCILLGIPHFLLDNRYGKVRSFHEAWTRECRLTRWCEHESEALALASCEGAADC